MAEHVHVGVLDGAQHRSVMRSGSWVVRSGPRPRRGRAARGIVGQIQRAIGEDVALDPGQQRDALELVVQRAHRGGVCERAPFVEAVRHRERLAVVGDGDVLAARRGAARAIASSVSRPSVPVVCMCRSPRRSALDQAGQAPVAAALDLAAVLRATPAGSRRGRAPRRRLLRLAGDALVRPRVNTPYSLVSSRARWRSFATTMLCSLPGEVLDARCRASAGHHAQVHLEPIAQAHARLGVALFRACVGHVGIAGERRPSRPRSRPPHASTSRSPTVSRRRRRLPTGSNVGDGRPLRAGVPSACACCQSSAGRVAASVTLRCSSTRLQDQGRFLRAPCPCRAANRARRGGRASRSSIVRCRAPR